MQKKSEFQSAAITEFLQYYQVVRMASVYTVKAYCGISRARKYLDYHEIRPCKSGAIKKNCGAVMDALREGIDQLRLFEYTPE